MRIAFDVQPLIDGEKTGVGYCEAGIIRKLPKLYKGNNYFLEYFSFKNTKEQTDLIKAYELENCKSRSCAWFPGSLYRFIWNFIPVPYSLFFCGKSDITHFFNYHIPPGVFGIRICTVHDMGYKAFPETVRFKTKMMLNLSLKRSCKRAHRIITDSEFSKTEIMKYLGIHGEKISVVPCGVDISFYKPATSSAIKAAADKYGVPGSYFLYLGTLEPRKNIERLTEAYAAFKKENPVAPVLVLAGRKGWLYDSIFEHVKTLDIENSVIFTGYVDDLDKPALYSGATAFLFPSLYEGFGLPPLEAMACGCPVITSNCSSLPEVVGDSAILVNPYSVNEIKNSMKRLVEDESLRKELSRKGIQRAKVFTWEKPAQMLMQIYRELTGKS